jgi:hypothetical protein
MMQADSRIQEEDDMATSRYREDIITITKCPPEDAAEVEKTMRELAHSPLDWQSPRAWRELAREAWAEVQGTRPFPIEFQLPDCPETRALAAATTQDEWDAALQPFYARFGDRLNGAEVETLNHAFGLYKYGPETATRQRYTVTGFMNFGQGPADFVADIQAHSEAEAIARAEKDLGMEVVSVAPTPTKA